MTEEVKKPETPLKKGSETKPEPVAEVKPQVPDGYVLVKMSPTGGMVLRPKYPGEK